MRIVSTHSDSRMYIAVPMIDDSESFVIIKAAPASHSALERDLWQLSEAGVNARVIQVSNTIKTMNETDLFAQYPDHGERHP